MTGTKTVLCSSALLVGLLVGSPGLLADTPLNYETALDRLEECLEADDCKTASTLLTQLCDAYPQDVSLRLRKAWFHFQHKEYTKALDDYERADALSPGHLDARLGMGWSLYYLGRIREAHEQFRWVSDRRAHYLTVDQGLSLTAPRSRVWTDVSGSYHHYQDNPHKTQAVCITIGLGTLWKDRLLLTGRYRHTRFEVRSGNGYASQWLGTSFEQSEGYGSVGWHFARFVLRAHYGVAVYSLDDSDDTHVAGLSSSLDLWGRWALETSAAFVDEERIYRTAVAWAWNPVTFLTLIPGGAWQFDETEHFWTASLGLGVQLPLTHLMVQGRYGTASRPAYLVDEVIFNIPERIDWGADATLSFDLGKGFGASALYEFHRLRSLSSSEQQNSNMHVFLFGFNLGFDCEP